MAIDISYKGAEAPPTKLISARYDTDLKPHLLSMTISRTMDQISELVVNVDDPKWSIIKLVGEPLSARIETMGLDYIVDSFDIDAGGGEGGMTLNCRPSRVRALKDRRGAFVMNRVSPTTWVKHEVEAVGGSFVGQPSPVRSQVSRQVTSGNSGSGSSKDEKPSSWTTIKTLSEELGYIFYEDGNTFYFGKPTWLVNNIGKIRIDLNHPEVAMRPTTIPTASASLDEPNGTEYSFSMGVEFAGEMKPGTAVELVNFPIRNGLYLLTSLNHPIYGSASDVSLTLKKPVDPEVTKAA